MNSPIKLISESHGRLRGSRIMTALEVQLLALWYRNYIQHLPVDSKWLHDLTGLFMRIQYEGGAIEKYRTYKFVTVPQDKQLKDCVHPLGTWTDNIEEAQRQISDVDLSQWGTAYILTADIKPSLVVATTQSVFDYLEKQYDATRSKKVLAVLNQVKMVLADRGEDYILYDPMRSLTYVSQQVY